jgi:hypothetical protein
MSRYCFDVEVFLKFSPHTQRYTPYQNPKQSVQSNFTSTGRILCQVRLMLSLMSRSVPLCDIYSFDTSVA